MEDSPDDGLVDLIAFALVEVQRIEWIKHSEAQNGTSPSEVEIQHWYRQQPPGVLDRAKVSAENALKGMYHEFIEDTIEEIVDDVEEGIIVGEIRNLRRFWPQFGVNVAGGFAAALLFAALLAILAFVILGDASPGEVGEQLRDTMEESNHDR